MGNGKTCSTIGCAKPVQARDVCMTHYQQWSRKARRCALDGCSNFLEDGGRRMGNGRGRKGYCREHEWIHLRANPGIEASNRQLLANQLYPEAGCWGGVGELLNGGPYIAFEPVGAGKTKWVLHRAVWGFLIGGHDQRLGKRAEPVQLDHLASCWLGPQCAAPFHLEPVTRSENQRRKFDRSGVSPTNWEAASNPRLQKFAMEFRLPLPTPARALAA